jgi:tetratricopeptide (TPR) repeat protein
MCLSPESPLFDESMQKLVDCGLAIARGETAPALFLAYAEALWNVRDLHATIAALDRAISGVPRLPDHEVTRAYASRAICHLQLDHLDAALADATMSINLMPRGHAYSLRAMTYLFMGHLAEAVADAEEGVRLDPDDWEARSWRGMVYLEVGRYAEAIADFDWVLATGECNRYASELYLGRARARLALGDPAGAIDDCALAIDEDYHEQSHWPFIVRARVRQAHQPYLIRAEARLRLGQTARALGDCCFAATIAPDDPSVYELRARVYYAVGNLQEVIRDTIRAEHFRGRAGRFPASPAQDTSTRDAADRLVSASA